MYDDLTIELHRTVAELYARAEAKVRAGRLPDRPWSELLADEAQEQGHKAQYQQAA